MSVRPAQARDIDQLMVLAAHMHREAPAYRLWTFDHDKVRALLLRLVGGAGCLLVSEIDGFISGGIAGICTEHWFSREMVATDLALFLDPQYRNGTTAMRLIVGFLKWSELAGAKRACLGITTGVHPASTARLYAACDLVSSGATFSKDF